MKIEYPGLCFLRSVRPVAISTDGVTISIPGSPNNSPTDPACALVLPISLAEHFLLKQQGNEFISIGRGIDIPNDLPLPEVFDGSQDLHGKKILVIMFNGWGDVIRVQPAFRALFEEVAKTGLPPKITLAGSWIKSFPYLDAPYICDVRPNTLTLEEMGRFDVMINLTPLNQLRTRNRSMQDHYLEAFGMAGLKDRRLPPSILPDFKRVNRLRPLLDEIRSRTGKKLLYLNWKSRLPHKNAAPELIFETAQRLSDEYCAVFFKDPPVAGVMEDEARARGACVQNLSHLIDDLHDTVAAISLVDVLISVDTGIVHAAGALNVPGVALFGPFPPETHIADYKSIIGVRADYQGAGCQGPCEETYHGCAEAGFSSQRISPCFEALTPENVIEALNEALDRVD